MRVAVALVLIAPLVATACKKKEPEPAGRNADTSEQAPRFTAAMPDTPEARQFARRLVELTVNGWSPTASSDFELNAMTFAVDGTWKATGHVTSGVDNYECIENGTWGISDAESATSASVDLVVARACPNRNKGDVNRVKIMVLENGTTKILAR